MYRRVLNRKQRKAFSHFFSHATVNAITHIQDDVGFHRWMWVIILLVSTGVCIRQLVMVSNKYISRPVKTTTVLDYATVKDFPAVTICNLNPMKFKQIKAIKGTGTNIVDKSTPQPTKSALKSTSQPSNYSYSTASPSSASKYSEYHNLNKAQSQQLALKGLFEFFKQTNTSLIGGKDWNVSTSTVRNDRYQLERLMFLMDTIDKSVLKELTYDIDELLIDCSFHSKNCVPSDFVSLSNSQYGKCFVFNSGFDARGNPVPIRNVTRSGTLHSLELTLFVNQDEYLPSITEAGYKLIIHDQRHPPMPEDEGLSVGPGFFTSLSLRHRRFQAAEAPYGTCREFSKPDNISMNMYLLQLPLTSPNQKTCIRTCEQLNVIKNCHCYSLLHGFQMAEAFSDVRNNTKYLRACTVERSSREFICLRDTLMNVSLGIIPCKAKFCKYRNCFHEVFATSQSIATWPSMNTLSAFRDIIMRHRIPAIQRFFSKKRTATEYKTFIKNNFVKVRVYFEDLSVINLITMPSYNFNDLLADVGGITGLWLGLSVITIFDTLELIIDVCRAICSGRKKREDTDGADAHEEIEMTAPLSQ